MSKKLPDTLTEDEQRLLLKQFDKKKYTGYRDFLITKTALVDGLRESELVLLQWEDINLMSGQLHVKNKNPDRNRVVNADKSLLKDYRKYLKVFALTPEGLVFPTRTGRSITPQYLRKVIPDKARSAGIKKRVHVQLLRDTAGLRFFEDSGGDLLATRDFIGHKNVQSTLKYQLMSNLRIKKVIDSRDFSYLD